MNRGHKSPILLKFIQMIAEEHIKSIIDRETRKMNLFLVDMKISSSAVINVFVDSIRGVTIKECALLSAVIKEKLKKYIDNYALEVSSPGLDRPLLLTEQYEKNLGRRLDIVTKDGRKKTGRLINVLKKGIEIESEVLEKNKSGKGKKHVIKKFAVDFAEIKSAKVVVSFN
jgi:ribosome maturation factor RimP